MNLVTVYDKLIAIFEREWTRYKVDGGQDLAPVGQNRKGVYQGFPMTLMDYPCLGIMPADGDQELAGSNNCEDITNEFQIYFYAFDFRNEQSARLVLEMDHAVNEIIKNNRQLDGLVDQVTVTTTQRGEFLRRAFDGAEIIACGGMKTIKIEEIAV